MHKRVAEHALSPLQMSDAVDNASAMFYAVSLACALP
jgi:hypothetical protein